MFQFTHPRGVRLGIVPSALAEGDVSIHAPARGATYPCTTEEWNKLFQFTHPRGVRLRHQSRWSHRCRVSIHAPARGATNQRLRQRTLPKRFNSRTREGCDAIVGFEDFEQAEFQFTHPRGVRRGEAGAPGGGERVSIHAPARGATRVNSFMLSKEQFQFTHPRGVRRRSRSMRSRRTLRFNSRTREGCDAAWRIALRSSAVFQFTHPRGVRQDDADPFEGKIKFQFTHPRGVRQERPLCSRSRTDVSIHAPARGATSSPPAGSRKRWGFNSRTREGCDRSSTEEVGGG